MDFNDFSSANIKMKVSTNDVKESNLFLRRFYDELSKHIKLGWNFCSYRKDNVIFLGFSNFGRMWFDYKQKGTIDTVYISINENDSEIYNIVNNALIEAINNHVEQKKYNIIVEFETGELLFNTMCKNDIKIESQRICKNKFKTFISFNVQAFGDFDLKYISTQKINYLKHLLCAYTNHIFKCSEIVVINDEKQYSTSKELNYDIEWLEECYEGKEVKNVSLVADFFDIFYQILQEDSYKKTIRLLLNSAQEIYCAKLMMDDYHTNPRYNIPGYTDIINTILVSVLEPLSNIGADKPEQCRECGNLKYRIGGKIKKLCMEYLPEHLANEISKIEYSKRSAFLHEGNARTNEFYSGKCVPLIDTRTQNSIFEPSATVRYNNFEYVTYIYRHKVRDLLDDISLLKS